MTGTGGSKRQGKGSKTQDRDETSRARKGKARFKANPER
ncbi:hypothetical protein FOQG_03057 [Fusarium oxysporum f. sp. raphani 54005]|uniref:Uncharacterized protein n=7 Tax=Fusarium oxysporum TaxID=5507 RepID=W9IL71_FUSOX|nr:hypothetical protein FOXG_17945 [Fusarium oxysporum f. sp. lycopersici 4287]EWY93276.1 hypothetical protein FOYG_06548 [Fusarium oxysporum NRRL 32931]EWZ51420.1 hypothetical protein FOZG_01507 [Fusarium oxysporum Fo47]EXA52353.1 hypothetical protein FOVG_00677 [Fusarium oxysporum f. sp. pisi HDV247]EXK95761.1 hypothetical protein FOQG_03057 [Fusarium oxysporum f. sp. raphani 54005]EXL43455.1 hypothetical protein FOCG_13893 [Fusarium oxysporum f. sp. radicis-lycopersici 26381]EXL86742.1 hyp